MNYPLEEILLPMGGNTVKDEAKMEALWGSPEYVAEEKYDGSRYVSVGGRFFSRKLSVKTNFPVEKTDNVPHLNFLRKYPQLILDGEVYFDGMNSNDVTKIMGSKPEKAIARQEEGGYLKYVAFDILRDLQGNWLMDKPWHERREILVRTVTYIGVDHAEVGTYLQDIFSFSKAVKDDKREFYKEIMARNGEGVMLKNINGTYRPDKKPAWNWVKVKKHITADVIITGFKPAKREYKGEEHATHQWWEAINGDIWQLNGEKEAEQEGRSYGYPFTAVTKFYAMKWIGSIIFSKYDADGNLVEVGECSGINEELRADMTDNPDKYLGQVMEIGAMEVTKDGFYRHPQFSRFRDDKNARECLVGVD